MQKLAILGTLKQLSCIPSRLYNAVCLTMCLFASSLSLIVLIPLKESNSADLCFVLLCIYAVCRWPQDEGVHVPIYQVKGTCTGLKAVCTVHKSVFTGHKAVCTGHLHCTGYHKAPREILSPISSSP